MTYFLAISQASKVDVRKQILDLETLQFFEKNKNSNRYSRFPNFNSIFP